MTPIHTIALLTLIPFAGTTPQMHVPIDLFVPTVFYQRVAAYVELHRQAAVSAGDSTYCAEPEELSRQAAYLAASIRRARPLANEGDVFTAAVAPAFRARIAYAMRIESIETPAAADDEALPIEVNEPVPWGTAHHPWLALLRVLPSLPPELEFRIVGRHLVLLDVPANLVVDVLRDALPASTRAIRGRDACDVHPDLPACRES